MKIVVDIEKSEPQFAQLISQIKQAIIADKVGSGDALPSIRQLARDLELNSKTVAKAYKLLERDNIIVTKGYRGTFVHDQAKANCSIDLSAWTLGVLTETLCKLKDAGVTDSEIRIAFKTSMNNQTYADKNNGV